MQAKDQTTPKLWQQICEDWVANGRDWSSPGFHAVAVHRFGVRIRKIRPKLLRAPFAGIYLSLYRFVRNFYGIELPPGTKVGRRLWIGHQSGIVIHPDAEFGDDCLVRQNVTIGSGTEDRFQDGPKLGNAVRVGAGAAIIGRVTVGDGVTVGPNAVVTTDVPAGSIVFGNPARIAQLPRSKEPKQEAPKEKPPKERRVEAEDTRAVKEARI